MEDMGLMRGTFEHIGPSKTISRHPQTLEILSAKEHNHPCNCQKRGPTFLLVE